MLCLFGDMPVMPPPSPPLTDTRHPISDIRHGMLTPQGRTFDGHMLDMIELGLVGYRGLGELPGLAKRVGSKPAFVFSGEKWGREEAYRKLQNILLGTLCVSF